MQSHDLQHRMEKGRAAWVVSPVTAVFVSLYLILIAFFVVLNSISRFEETRKNAALSSVDATFARPLPGPLTDRPARPETVDPDFFRILAGLLSEVLEPGARVRGPIDDRLSVVAPAGILFQTGRVTVRADRIGFVRALGAAGAGAAPGTRRLTSVRVGPEESGPDAIQTARRRAGALGRALSQAGYPAGSFSVGLAPEQPGRVVMVFSARRRP
ncbi:MAG: hypothetical protein ACFB22_05690 [Rhodothalassiaceae bacterium]